MNVYGPIDSNEEGNVIWFNEEQYKREPFLMKKAHQKVINDCIVICSNDEYLWKVKASIDVNKEGFSNITCFYF